jgi:hypothetical protein
MGSPIRFETSITNLGQSFSVAPLSLRDTGNRRKKKSVSSLIGLATKVQQCMFIMKTRWCCHVSHPGANEPTGGHGCLLVLMDCIRKHLHQA